MNLPPRPSGGVLGLDLARRTGWAYAYPGGEHASGEIDLPPVHPWGAQKAAAFDALSELVAAYRPAFAGVEAPIMRSTDAVDVLRTGFGLAAIAELVLYDADVRSVWFPPPNTVRATVLRDGSLGGNKVKSVIIQWCRDRGWFCVGNDAADATVVREYAARMAQVAGAHTDTPWDGRRQWKGEIL